jgi:hypothetical protein
VFAVLPSPRARRLALRVAASFVFRFACYGVMLWLALLAEARPAPRLPDLVLERVPYVPWVDRWNYVLWLVSYGPVALWLLVRDAERFVRYMVSSGFLALLRGVCIVATGLGPVRGEDVHAGMDLAARTEAFWHLYAPAFFSPTNGAAVYLTKDLFFSGHTATTCLLLLYVWRYPAVRWVMLAAHALVVVSLFLAHLHYTIDVIGAYAVTLALFALREGRLGAR